MTGNYKQSPRTAALLRAFHREAARGPVYSWGESSCVTMYKTFSEELGAESPDYSEYECLSERKAIAHSIRNGGSAKVHERILGTVGWKRVEGKTVPGDIVFFGHPTEKVEIKSTNYRTQYIVRPKAEIGAVVMPDKFAYWWTPLGVLPIMPDWDPDKILFKLRLAV